ncbi:MAG: hypothetical protein JXR44_00115 [Thiotrichales bacterium]|nr:hypothetical protein [Thiotrichales bacterium]
MGAKPQCLQLFGLPGCGKRRLAQAWQDRVGCLIEPVPFNALPLLKSDSNTVRCLVVDARSFWQQSRDAWLEAKLQCLLQAAQLVVLHFLEATSLELQQRWQQWLRQQAPDLPIRLSVQHALPSGLFDTLRPSLDFTAVQKPVDTWQTHTFCLERPNLEQVLMVLDNAKSALGMRIARVQGVLATQEYANWVQIEGSALRWDLFAAAELLPSLFLGQLRIEGEALDLVWLESALLTCDSPSKTV